MPAPKVNRKKILEEISRLFLEQGYEKTSIRAIANALGMSNSGLYYYFKSKQEMLFTIIDEFMNRTLKLKDEVSAIQDPKEKFLYIIKSHIKSFVEFKPQTKVVIYEGHFLEGEYARIIREKEIKYSNLVKELVAGIKVDCNINTSIATLCLFGTLNWVVQWYNPNGEVSPDTLAENIAQIFINGLKGKSSEFPHNMGGSEK